MKKITIQFLFSSIAILVTMVCLAQDIITLKTGDEIKSKVLEVTIDLVKYKKRSEERRVGKECA